MDCHSGQMKSPSVASCRSHVRLGYWGVLGLSCSLVLFWDFELHWVVEFPEILLVLTVSETFLVGSSSLKHRTTCAARHSQNWTHKLGARAQLQCGSDLVSGCAV